VPYYYHYTSRQFAQNIGCTGQLKPGRNGFVYLTPQLYASGIEAADKLSITNKPVEIGVEVDIGISRLSPTPPTPVPPIRDSSGAFIRRGGGMEVMVNSPVHIGNPPKWISLIEP
jgi:hypothetical protein